MGVNIFILISGYYLVASKKFKFSKAIKLWLQIFIFALVLFLIFDRSVFNASTVVTLFTPIGHYVWWFLTVYIIMLLLYPFINKLIYKLSKKQYLLLIIIMSFIWTIYPSVLNISFEWSNVIWFIYLYLIAGFIRLYCNKISFKPWLGILVFVICYLIFTVLECLINNISNKGYILNLITNFINIGNINNLISLILCVILFFSFINFKPHYNKFINVLGAGVLGVYLLHDYTSVRSWLWIDLFKNATYQSSAMHTLFNICYCVCICCLYNYINYI